MNKTTNFQVLAQDQMNQIVGGGTGNATVTSGTLGVNESRSIDTGDSGLDFDLQAELG